MKNCIYYICCSHSFRISVPNVAGHKGKGSSAVSASTNSNDAFPTDVLASTVGDSTSKGGPSPVTTFVVENRSRNFKEDGIGSGIVGTKGHVSISFEDRGVGVCVRDFTTQKDKSVGTKAIFDTEVNNIVSRSNHGADDLRRALHTAETLAIGLVARSGHKEGEGVGVVFNVLREGKGEAKGEQESTTCHFSFRDGNVW